MHFIHLHPSDSVAIALVPLTSGETICGESFELSLINDVPAGHKFAIKALEPGDVVMKYGAEIGSATNSIAVGEHVHVHNIKTRLEGLEEYEYNPIEAWQPEVSKTWSFQGYRREDGRVGTRNEIWVISSVGCVARFAERIARAADTECAGQCDGVVALTHPFGCSQTGGDHENTRKLTAALAQHPNAGAILLVGLGCENNQIRDILSLLPESRRKRVRYFNCQEVDDEMSEGVDAIRDLAAITQADKREACSASELVVGMKCGGSDGFSGLSANPLVGRIADKVCAAEGTVLLTETPEMFGAERILMNRAENEAVFQKTVSLINDFKAYFIEHKQNIYENPSPGNKEGGISTLEEKSMGAIQKGGSAIVKGVLDYAEPVKESGLNLLQSPGNDAVSSTALAASGATIILFTTGRGTPLGFPAPTVKIASNSKLATAKSTWIDFDAEPVLHGKSLDEVSDELMDVILAIASGERKTKSELNEQREIAIWKNGVTL